MTARETRPALYRAAPHSLPRVWAALTTADVLKEWLMDSDFEPSVGRDFTFQCPPAEDTIGNVACTLLEMEPMRRIVWSWLPEGETQPTTVTIELEEENGGTRLTLRHRGEATKELGDKLSGGWNIKLAELVLHLGRTP